MPVSLLAHDVQGSGPPVLLLNGGLMSIAAWDAVAERLAARHRVVRCDFRGQWLSPGSPPPTPSGHVADVATLLGALDLDGAHVVGTSFGALVGILLAAERPHAVRSLTAVAATDHVSEDMWAGAEVVRAACLAALEGGDGGRVLDFVVPGTFSAAWQASHGEALRARRTAVAAMPPSWFSGLAGLLASLRHLDLRAAAARIACPTLVVAGEHDLTFPVDGARSLAGRVAGARLEVVPDGSHGLVVENAALVAALVESFVGGVEGRGEMTEWRQPSR